MKSIKILFTGISVVILLLIILNFQKIEGNLFSYAQSAINTLTVKSLPVGGISISADDLAYRGTTNYTKQVSQTISTWLTAPTTSDSYTFDCWKGCDYVDNNRCSVYVSNGITQEVTANYISTTSTATYDLAVTSLDIRSFICKNKDFDQNQLFWNEFSSRNPDYPYAPSTTYANRYYNEVASSTCPESQVNRPIEFSATAICQQGNCSSAKLQVKIEPQNPENYGIPLPYDSTNPKYETQIFETTYDANYPKSIKTIYIFNNAYDYKVRACVVDRNNNLIFDKDSSNNCKEWTLKIFNYFCMLGFPVRAQTNWSQQPPLRILQRLINDLPIIYWRNEICTGRIIS